MEVAPIRACGPDRRSPPKEVKGEAGPAGAGSSGYEEVVVGRGDANGEIDRTDATLLTDECVERPHVLGRFEAEGDRVAAPTQLFGAQRRETREPCPPDLSGRHRDAADA